jgi:hypothetical protein
MLSYVLTTGVVLLILILVVIVGRATIRALREFIVNLWPH